MTRALPVVSWPLYVKTTQKSKTPSLVKSQVILFLNAQYRLFKNVIKCNEQREWEEIVSAVQKRTNVLDEERSGGTNSLGGEFQRICQTFLTLHQMIITCFLTSRNFWPVRVLRSDQETKDAAQNWLKGLPTTFLDEGIQKPIPRYDKCHNWHGFRYQHAGMKIHFLNSSNAFYNQPVLTFWIRYVK